MAGLLRLAQNASTALAASPRTSAQKGPMLPKPRGPAPASRSYDAHDHGSEEPSEARRKLKGSLPIGMLCSSLLWYPKEQIDVTSEHPGEMPGAQSRGMEGLPDEVSCEVDAEVVDFVGNVITTGR
eukprot:7127231-Heterocapsa_arctica.AAC.1